MFKLPPPFSIRKMKTDDLPSIVEIEAQSDVTAWSQSMFENEIQASETGFSRPTGLLRHETLIGFCISWLIAGELQILLIALDRAYQGKGLATALLGEALLDALEKKSHLATLEVRESNVPAQALYRRLGFETVGRRLNFYKSPVLEDAILMNADLANPTFSGFLLSQLSHTSQHISTCFRDSNHADQR